MAKDIPQTVPQTALEPAAYDNALPAPRPPVDPAAHDSARPAPPAPVDSVAHDSARPVHGSRAGWIVSTVVAAGAAWAVGWVAGVSWAWRATTPWYLRRSHRRRGASLPGAGSPLRS
jgi:hypothetical protein